MSKDTIYREDAIEAILYSHLNVLTPQERQSLIEAIPSADVTDRPKGKWIGADRGYHHSYYANCSLCGYQIDTHYNRGYNRFCPNCGADMRGADDE